MKLSESYRKRIQQLAGITLSEGQLKNPSPEAIISSVIHNLQVWYYNEHKMDACDINSGECMNFAEAVYEELLNEYKIKTEILSDGLFWEPYGDIEDESLLAKPEEYGSTPTYNYKKLGLPSHYWIYYNGKHYDAERIKGINNFFELPTFVRFKEKYS